MSFGCKVGDSVFLPDDGGVHRYVVLTNPNKDDGIVIVNFTSAPNPMCDGKVFTRSDNRNLFVKPTVVHYKRAIIISITSLCEQERRTDVVSDYRHCSKSIMAQIIKDAFGSQFTVGDILRELKTNYPQEYGQYCEDTNLE